MKQSVRGARSETAQLTVPRARQRQQRIRAHTFCGSPIRFNDTFRLGAVTIEVTGVMGADEKPVASTVVLVLSSATFSALQAEEQVGGQTLLLDRVEKEMGEAAAMVQTRMVDLGPRPRKVVDRRTVTRPFSDRVEFVCTGISDLTSQMAHLLSLPQDTRSDGQVTQVAKRYAELASEMEKLRRAVIAAEGCFEVAQQQVMALMGDEECQ